MTGIRKDLFSTRGGQRGSKFCVVSWLGGFTEAEMTSVLIAHEPRLCPEASRLRRGDGPEASTSAREGARASVFWLRKQGVTPRCDSAEINH